MLVPGRTISPLMVLRFIYLIDFFAHRMDFRDYSFDHLFTIPTNIEGWPATISVSTGHYEGQEIVAFIKLISPATEDRDYIMRWVVSEETGMPAWEFQPMPGMAHLPDDLLALESEISDRIVTIDLSPFND